MAVERKQSALIGLLSRRDGAMIAEGRKVPHWLPRSVLRPADVPGSQLFKHGH